MNKIMRLLIVLLLLPCLAVVAAEQSSQKVESITLLDTLTQGAMVRGQVNVKAGVEVLGRSLRIDDEGYFVFGLGRDAEPGLTILIHHANGNTEKKTYSVLQREYDIQYVEGVASKYVSPPPEVSQRIANDAAMVKAARAESRPVSDYRKGFDWPVTGRISGVYGSQRVFNGVPKRPHYGLDIARPVGTPVVAPVEGLVTLAEPDLYYSGGTIIIDHGDGISSTFIHLSKIDVAKGQVVAKGDKIGEVGATGRVTGPHLDWRINWFEHRLDPALVLPPQPE